MNAAIIFIVDVCAQSCLTLCDPIDCSLPGSSVHGDSPGKNSGQGCHFLLQGIFPTQGQNPHLHLLHWQADFFISLPPGKPIIFISIRKNEIMTNWWQIEFWPEKEIIQTLNLAWLSDRMTNFISFPRIVLVLKLRNLTVWEPLSSGPLLTLFPKEITKHQKQFIADTLNHLPWEQQHKNINMVDKTDKPFEDYSNKIRCILWLFRNVYIDQLSQTSSWKSLIV